MKEDDPMKLKKNDRRWCWWMSRYLLFQRVLPNGDYEFTDFGDETVILSADKALALPERP